MKCTYPVIIEQDADAFFIHFPDIEGASTSGKTIKEAVEMARDALGDMLRYYEEENKPFPTPTPLDKVLLNDEQTLRLIDIDTEEYAKIIERMSQNPIRFAREQAGFTIKEPAEYLDAPYRTIQDWNAGKSRPPRWIENIIYNHILDAK